MRINLRSLMIYGWLTAAPSAVSSQALPQIWTLSAPAAKSSDHFGTILNVHELTDGNLLVNDGQRRQISMLDRTLGHRQVVLDSVPLRGQGYGEYAAPIIPYIADSTLFVDVASSALLVLNENGEVVRAMAAPRPAELILLREHLSGVDTKGNLIYQGLRSGDKSTPARGKSYDSLPLVRANIESRNAETVAMIGVASSMRVRFETSTARAVTIVTVSPLSIVDDWAVSSDGTIVIVRGHDYHVDWIAPNGDFGSGQKLAFDWKRLTDDDKQKLVDSAAAERARKTALAKPSSTSHPPLFPLPGGVYGMMKVVQGRDVSYTLVEEDPPLSEIPDYWPPIRLNATKSDLDNNIWILPTTSAQSKNGELVYDVVNNRGEMTKRVRVPAGRAIAGFGRNNVVYLMRREEQGWLIEKTSLVQQEINR